MLGLERLGAIRRYKAAKDDIFCKSLAPGNKVLYTIRHLSMLFSGWTKQNIHVDPRGPCRNRGIRT